MHLVCLKQLIFLKHTNMQGTEKDLCQVIISKSELVNFEHEILLLVIRTTEIKKWYNENNPTFDLHQNLDQTKS